MNYRIPLLSSFLLVFLLLGCQEKKLPPLPEPETTQLVFPTAEGEKAVQQKDTEGPYAPLVEEDLTPKVSIKPGENLLKIINVNLDLDRQGEQILILRNRDAIDSPIRIAILDYEEVIKNYRRTWEGTTMAADIRGFNVSIADIIGDHNFEIICAGVGLDNRQSLTVFRKTKPANKSGLFYTEIFSLMAKGTIEVLEITRSQSYEVGMRAGKSFPIVATVMNSESENMMDLIKSTYYWDFPSRRYIKIKEENIPGTKIAEDQLRKIYRGTKDVFREHISGPWFLSSDSRFLVEFDPTRGLVTFYSGEVQEVYYWKSTYKILGNLLRIGGVNELINHVENEVHVKLVDMSSLQITVKDIDTQTRLKTPNDLWSGRYYRYPSEAWKKGMTPIKTPSPPKLFGKYIGDTGEKLIIKGNRFTFTSAKESFQGGISLYYLGENLLNLRIMDEGNLSQEKSDLSLRICPNQFG